MHPFLLLGGFCGFIAGAANRVPFWRSRKGSVVRLQGRVFEAVATPAFIQRIVIYVSPELRQPTYPHAWNGPRATKFTVSTPWEKRAKNSLDRI